MTPARPGQGSNLRSDATEKSETVANVACEKKMSRAQLTEPIGKNKLLPKTPRGEHS